VLEIIRTRAEQRMFITDEADVFQSEHKQQSPHTNLYGKLYFYKHNGERDLGHP